MKKYLQYNKKLLFTFLGLLIFVISLNYFVNPYNIFKQHIFMKTLLKPEAKVQERLTKPIGLKIDKRKIDSVFMGSSRVDLCINKQDFYDITGKNAENIAIGGLHFDEIEQMVEIALKTHPEIKNVYLALDFQTFSKSDIDILNVNRTQITQNKKLDSKEIGSALISVNTTGNSIWTIIKNMLGIEKRMFYSAGHKHIFVNKSMNDEFIATKIEYTEKYKNYKLDYEKIEQLSAFKKSLNDRDVNLRIFIMPTHIILQNTVTESGNRANYNLWLRELVKVDDVWDFNYSNEYTQEEIKPNMQYFFDGSHSTHKYGQIIIQDLLTETPIYAHHLTKNNINFYAKETK